MGQLGGPPTEAVAAVAEVIGEKIHWIADPVRAEDLARIVLRAAGASGAVFLTDDERQALAAAAGDWLYRCADPGTDQQWLKTRNALLKSAREKLR